MEYRAEYTNTKKTLAEFYKYTVCRLYKIIGIIVLVIAVLQMVGVIGGTLEIMNLSFSKKTLILLIIMGCAELLIGILLCKYHVIMGNTAMKQGIKNHGGIMPKTVLEMGDTIIMTEGKTKSQFKYEQISLVRETKNLFCLMLGKYIGIIVPKKNIVKGNEKEFGNWIKKKCNKAW